MGKRNLNVFRWLLLYTFPDALIHHGRHKTKSAVFSNSSNNVLSIFVYLFNKHTILIDTCLSSIYWYNLGPVKKLALHFFREKKIHNPYNTPKPWPVCSSSHIVHSFLLSDDRGNCFFYILKSLIPNTNTGELGYDGLSGTRKIGPSYAKSVVYIWRILDMHWTGTKHIVRHMQKSVIQWSVISKFTCMS